MEKDNSNNENHNILSTYFSHQKKSKTVPKRKAFSKRGLFTSSTFASKLFLKLTSI